MHITITTLPGYGIREKKLLARKLKEAATMLMKVSPASVSVSVRDLPMEEWDEFIRGLPDDEIVIPETYKECKCLEKKNKEMCS